MDPFQGECAVRYWRHHAFDIGRSAWRGTCKVGLGESWLRTSEPNSDPRVYFRFSASRFADCRGYSCVLLEIDFFRGLPAAVMFNRTNDSLASIVDVHIANHRLRVNLSSIPVQSLH